MVLVSSIILRTINKKAEFSYVVSVSIASLALFCVRHPEKVLRLQRITSVISTKPSLFASSEASTHEFYIRGGGDLIHHQHRPRS